MYKIEKRFRVPVGHRLSKHSGRCINYHGHNLVILVGLKSPQLNDNDMVMDFADLKKMINGFIDKWDHAMILNENDPLLESYTNFSKRFRVMTYPFDPTAEKLTQVLFEEVDRALTNSTINVEYVTIYENDGSKATYCR